MNLSPGIIAIALMSMVSILIFFFGLARVVGGSSDQISTRLDKYASRPGASTSAKVTKDQRNRGKLAEEIDRELTKRGKSTDMAQELARADLKLTPGEFFLINMVAVIGAAIGGYFIFRQAFMALPTGIAGYFAPRIYLKFRQARRQSAFADQLPDAVGLLANSLRSGYSLPQSMELLSREMPPPISEEFSRVVREIGLGVAFEQALNNMVRRIKNDDLDLMVTAILVNHEVGGNLSQVLDIIGHTIRERIRIKGEIKVLTAQQKGAGYLVGSMPFILTVILFILNGDYMGELFRSLCGEILACTSFGFVATAFFLINKITNIEV